MADKMKKPDVRLEINGMKYGGWTKISIRRGIGQVAGTFELSITERWPGQPIPAKIELGASCVVTVDGAPVITGYVDDVAPSYNAASHTVSVTGRDKTCDLVDCCPPSTQLKGATLAAVARSLAAPFGIEVVDETGVGVVPGFKTNPGDTVFETLEQLARAKGVLLTTDGRGRQGQVFHARPLLERHRHRPDGGDGNVERQERLAAENRGDGRRCPAPSASRARR